MTVPAEKPKKVVPKKIAIVVHQEQSRPGRVGALLEKRGYELHRLCPNLGCLDCLHVAPSVSRGAKCAVCIV